MRLALGVLALAAATPIFELALAFPDGAPWGAANPDEKQNCAACHFDGDAVHDSDALAVLGLPDNLTADTAYELTVQFENPGGFAAGFQMIAAAGDQAAGTFTSDAAHTEAAGAAIRSTRPIEHEGRVSWSVTWRTPTNIGADISLFVAASAANFDRSAFGDNIHFRYYRFVHHRGL